MPFERTKNAIARGQAVKARVQGAPEATKAAAAQLARNAGKRVINLGNHCKNSESRRHQADSSRLNETWKDEATGQQYQLIFCRCCGDVMRALLLGRKN